MAQPCEVPGTWVQGRVLGRSKPTRPSPQVPLSRDTPGSNLAIWIGAARLLHPRFFRCHLMPLRENTLAVLPALYQAEEPSSTADTRSTPPEEPKTSSHFHSRKPSHLHLTSIPPSSTPKKPCKSKIIAVYGPNCQSREECAGSEKTRPLELLSCSRSGVHSQRLSGSDLIGISSSKNGSLSHRRCRRPLKGLDLRAVRISSTVLYQLADSNPILTASICVEFCKLIAQSIHTASQLQADHRPSSHRRSDPARRHHCASLAAPP